MERLKIATYNVSGIKNVNWAFLHSVVDSHSFTFIQEHWLHSSEFHLFGDKLTCGFTSTSAMPDDAFIRGRPYGGCAILWSTGLTCAVEPLKCRSRRLCAVKVTLEDLVLILYSVYMPCDTDIDAANAAEFEEVLREISDFAHSLDIDHIICGGDFNTDAGRERSLHTVSLRRFVETESLYWLVDDDLCDVQYTYESRINMSRSKIDHFIVSNNLLPCVENVFSYAEADNTSDHNVLRIVMNVNVNCISMEDVYRSDDVDWAKVSEDDVHRYKQCLNTALDNVTIPWIAVTETTSPHLDLSEPVAKFHDDVIEACISAADASLPKHRRGRIIPGWNEFVKPLREEALFWHALWKDNGSPHTGVVSEIRRLSRARYHRMLRQVRKQEEALRKLKLAHQFGTPNRRDFWTEVKKSKGGRVSCPTSIDGIMGNDEICETFTHQYEHLYQSVPYNVEEMNDVCRNLDGNIISHVQEQTGSCHEMNGADVAKAIEKLRLNKNDGQMGLRTNHVIYGSQKLFLYLSILFSCMIKHMVVPESFALSTIIPIPKDKRKSLNDSSNYRAIALSSILGKILDHILLSKCSNHFLTSDYQFGFKRRHSTVMCTFVVEETVQHYMNGQSDVYCTLLDASKAFDRVEYVKLFHCLIKKGLCPIICRFLAMLYTKQTIRVRWKNSTGSTFSCLNGVRQGGVMSPILFSVYIDELILRLKELDLGCHINDVFTGVVSYADDLVLLSPTVSTTKSMLHVCEQYGKEFNVKFNPTKTKLIVFSNRRGHVVSPKLQFMNEMIEVVPHHKHLGNLIGNISQEEVIATLTSDMQMRTNFVKHHFSGLTLESMYFLFKSHCTSFYGLPLIDFSHQSFQTLCTSWRKCVRHVLGLPYRTHSHLLYLICNDRPIHTQLFNRFLSFLKCVQSSSNSIVSACYELVLAGSSSKVSNSVTHLCEQFSANRDDLVTCSFQATDPPSEQDSSDAQTVIEVINMRNASFIFQPFLSFDECNRLIELLCTN